MAEFSLKGNTQTTSYTTNSQGKVVKGATTYQNSKSNNSTSTNTNKSNSPTGVFVEYTNSPIKDIKSGQQLTSGQGMINIGGGATRGGVSIPISSNPYSSSAGYSALATGLSVGASKQVQTQVQQQQAQQQPQQTQQQQSQFGQGKFAGNGATGSWNTMAYDTKALLSDLSKEDMTRFPFTKTSANKTENKNYGQRALNIIGDGASYYGKNAKRSYDKNIGVNQNDVEVVSPLDFVTYFTKQVPTHKIQIQNGKAVNVEKQPTQILYEAGENIKQFTNKADRYLTYLNNPLAFKTQIKDGNQIIVDTRTTGQKVTSGLTNFVPITALNLAEIGVTYPARTSDLIAGKLSFEKAVPTIIENVIPAYSFGKSITPAIQNKLIGTLGETKLASSSQTLRSFLIPQEKSLIKSVAGGVWTTTKIGVVTAGAGVITYSLATSETPYMDFSKLVAQGTFISGLSYGASKVGTAISNKLTYAEIPNIPVKELLKTKIAGKTQESFVSTGDGIYSGSATSKNMLGTQYTFVREGVFNANQLQINGNKIGQVQASELFSKRFNYGGTTYGQTIGIETNLNLRSLIVNQDGSIGAVSVAKQIAEIKQNKYVRSSYVVRSDMKSQDVTSMTDRVSIYKKPFEVEKTLSNIQIKSDVFNVNNVKDIFVSKQNAFKFLKKDEFKPQVEVPMIKSGAVGKINSVIYTAEGKNVFFGSQKSQLRVENIRVNGENQPYYIIDFSLTKPKPFIPINKQGAGASTGGSSSNVGGFYQDPKTSTQSTGLSSGSSSNAFSQFLNVKQGQVYGKELAKNVFSGVFNNKVTFAQEVSQSFFLPMAPAINLIGITRQRTKQFTNISQDLKQTQTTRQQQNQITQTITKTNLSQGLDLTQSTKTDVLTKSIQDLKLDLKQIETPAIRTTLITTTTPPLIPAITIMPPFLNLPFKTKQRKKKYGLSIKERRLIKTSAVYRIQPDLLSTTISYATFGSATAPKLSNKQQNQMAYELVKEGRMIFPTQELMSKKPSKRGVFLNPSNLMK